MHSALYAVYGHPFSEYCSYEKNIFFLIFFEDNFLFYARKQNLRIFGLKLTELKKFQNQEMQKITIGEVFNLFFCIQQTLNI